jgi:DAK2 domain fusion protein YloV
MTTTDERALDPVVAALTAAHRALAARVEEINDLNVFPVADGDTGTNMLITLSAATDAVASRDHAERADQIARAVLLAARGNSGMILSQLVRGAAEALAGADPLDGAAARAAFRRASDAAYAAVREPVEGTMLTVARRMAEAAERAEREAGFTEVVAAALGASWHAVEETTGLLPALAQAKVVDSGGLGLAVMLDGIAAHLEGREIAAPAEAARVSSSADEHPPSRFRYCTTFVIEGDRLDLKGLEGRLVPLGDSLLIMGDAGQAKVHIHTDEPRRAVAEGELTGRVSGLNVDDMREQEAERSARIARRLGAVAADGGTAVVIVESEQLARIAQGLGARPVVDVTQLRAVIAESTPTSTVVVAYEEHAAQVRTIVEEHDVPLVAAPSLPAALACLVAFDGPGGRDERLAEMTALAGEVVAASVPTGVGDPEEALQDAVRAVAGDGAGLITVLIGEGIAAAANEVEDWVRAVAPGLEVEAHRAGLTRHAFQIGAE